jgi:hypothetical protein
MITPPVVASPEADQNGMEEWNRNNRRVAGVKELGHFKSAANLELLKSLLDDPGFQVWQVYRLVWEPKRHYVVRKAAYEVLRDWGVAVSEPVTEERLPWQYDPAAREKRVVEVPTKIGISLAGDEAVFYCHPNAGELTNLLTGSNMIVGETFAWRIWPAGGALTNEVTRTASWFAPEAWSREEFKLASDGLPAPGQKYQATLDFTVFETDQPPPDDNWAPQRNWHPEAGKHYRVLVQRKFEQTSE